MHERYTNRERYFQEQSFTTERFVIPFIREVAPVTPESKVLEIGSGEGGNLKPFVDMGCLVYGIDLSTSKITNGIKFFENHPNNKNIKLIAEDIYKSDLSSLPKFDIIMLRDTLEHIYDQDKFLEHLKNFMAPGGKVFLGFPPWYMPFGGHQQICESKFLRKLPYFHLLPRFMYKGMLKMFGESEAKITNLMEVWDTRISINRFKRIIKKRNFTIEKETFYMINPNYEVKFNLKTRALPKILNIPILRDFITTTYYCVISLK